MPDKSGVNGPSTVHIVQYCSINPTLETRMNADIDPGFPR